MKAFLLLCLAAAALGDGYGPAVDTRSYVAPVPKAPVIVPKVAYTAPKADYGAPKTVVVPAPAPRVNYAAPVAYVAPRTTAAPVYVAPTTAAPVYVAPKVLTPAPVPSYAAPVPAPVAKSGYEREEANPEPGYGIVVKHEEVFSPETKVDIDFAWIAPGYARVEKHNGYAPTVEYAAPVKSEGYAAATSYEAPATYGAPLKVMAERRADDSRYAPRADVTSRAYLKLQQDFGASRGVHMADMYGNVMDAVYADATPNYKFAYGVEDPASGDQKHVSEERFGTESRGSYSFVQPDGCTRSVRYMTGADSGFHALVEYAGPGCKERYEL